MAFSSRNITSLTRFFARVLAVFSPVVGPARGASPGDFVARVTLTALLVAPLTEKSVHAFQTIAANFVAGHASVRTCLFTHISIETVEAAGACVGDIVTRAWRAVHTTDISSAMV